MHTPFDWVAVIIFAGLLVLFLSRFSGANAHDEPLWPFLVATGGCAGINWLGNEGYYLPAVAAVAAVLYFIHRYLDPIGRPPFQ